MAPVIVADNAERFHLVPESSAVIPALRPLVLRDIGELPRMCHLMKESCKDAPERAVEVDAVDVDVDLLPDRPIVSPQPSEGNRIRTFLITAG